jgi:Na+-translocating ferredoxin:NAD+ oxidoreductase RNF subunit RnfB
MNLDQSTEFDESAIVLQMDNVSYEEAYALNNCPVVDVNKLIEIISQVLGEIVKETDSLPDQQITSFHAKSVPAITLKDYLNRISKCSKCSQECLILALIYIDRVTERHPSLIIRSLNIHRYY